MLNSTSFFRISCYFWIFGYFVIFLESINLWITRWQPWKVVKHPPWVVSYRGIGNEVAKMWDVKWRNLNQLIIACKVLAKKFKLNGIRKRFSMHESVFSKISATILISNNLRKEQNFFCESSKVLMRSECILNQFWVFEIVYFKSFKFT